MADPNLNNAHVGAGAAGGAPPAAHDPYQAAVSELLLPPDIFALLDPAFDKLGCKLVKDEQSIKHFDKKPLPHYSAMLSTGKIFLLHVSSIVTANPYGLPYLHYVVSPFLSQASGLFIVSEVENLAFVESEVEAMIATWQYGRPDLHTEFILSARIQELEIAPDDNARAEKIKEWPSFNELLPSSLPLDALLEDAYQRCRPDLLNSAQGLPEKLTKADRESIVQWLGPVASGPPDFNVKRYYWNLLNKLGLDSELYQFIVSALDGKNAWDYARDLLLSLEERTYANGAMPGYTKILGYLLYCLADEGGGKQIVMIIFKYRLVDNLASLKELMKKYP